MSKDGFAIDFPDSQLQSWIAHSNVLKFKKKTLPTLFLNLSHKISTKREIRENISNVLKFKKKPPNPLFEPTAIKSCCIILQTVSTKKKIRTLVTFLK